MDLYDKITEASRFIGSQIKEKPRMGIVLGSGLGDFVDRLSNKTVIDYEDIPHFEKVGTPGHMGRLVLGEVGKKRIAALQGRYHYYEGYDIADVVFPVRVLCALGIDTLLLTNAAGGIHPDLEPGDLMPICDHINLMGANPLRGPHDQRLGTRFPDTTEIYGKMWIDRACNILKKMKLKARPGIYAAMSGPSYETPAEIRMLGAMGADAVGMSTVPEALAARHMGVAIVGISCITNYASGISDRPLSHDEVTRTAKTIKKQFDALITALIES